MRLLLDENLPKRLKLDFPEHEIQTIRDKQWNGIKNGELMKLSPKVNEYLRSGILNPGPIIIMEG